MHTLTQRMSVLVSEQSDSSTPKQYSVYVKGAPETIEQLCTPDSSESDHYMNV